MQNIQLRVKQNDGIYDNGRQHSQLLQERVLDLHYIGQSLQLIATEVKISWHFVQNVLTNYDFNNSSIPGTRVVPPQTKIVVNVIKLNF